MKYCKKCVMPDTRPGLGFDDEGVCFACRNHEKKSEIDWNSRFKELKTLCDKYRGKYGDSYDCIIAVSGGKDSHYQVYVMKELMGMNPLLVTVEDNFPMTEAGKHNIRNISEEFGCDIISLKPNIKVQKLLMRKTFEKYGKPTWYIDRLIYTYPIHMAIKFNIPLVVYGENISYEYGGYQKEESYSANEQIYNGVASEISWDELIDDNISMKDLSLCVFPGKKEIDALNLDSIYLSYFVDWNSYNNYLFAKKRGFKDLTHEWIREHHIENFDQVDSRAYMIHPWLKYPKFGHATATDYASRFIRYGFISREEAIELVKIHDHNLDSLALQDFLDFTGYSHKEFWDIVDSLYNKEIFEKTDGEWKLKNPIG
ncbi:N-acetyl sugar amidotransferase [Methanoplanus endosymbiosus]|uniref:N-acetyl sugar amidotransferase n=1 Tax=Methanoplanus endosymbiosus TaxID=33865 RepID=A0A9E7PL96_9EURY|nr:N-acetyl sugar amidotransferase [Methanoplanus endosymbiosus]UUX92258.1 N-acetyl sugar amidotransferase [Methanoplanus endosymbiosus]